ncbi:MAG: hypothetical protein ACI85O_003542, partial [Saprospiraceae bacterium]
MKNIILILFACFPIFAFAQLQDDFSDGDFTNNPTWTGNTDRYIVNPDGELQLNHVDAAGTTVSYLSVAANTADLTNWEFKVRLEFAPSTSNFARIYLNSNSPDVTGDVEGYYVKTGGISGADDAIELWRQDGNSDELLISGTVGGAGADPVEVRIRVERNAAANWILLVDYTGGTDYVSEGGANDATYNMGGYFGFWCSYTATRKDKFFLDDLLIEPLFIDIQAPALLAAAPENNTTVAVSFDEPIVGFDFGDFTINNGISVTAAEADVMNPALIRLTVSPLQNSQNYTVTATNVADASGNVLSTGSANFDFLEAQPVSEGDIIITEIMSDPTPVLGLPDAEFVEIFNRSDKIIDLNTLSFLSGDSPNALIGELMLPGEYVIICDDGFASDFTPFGKVAFTTNMPALTNSGDFVMIEDNAGMEIDRVDYSISWFEDEDKAAGGWTLERIGAQADSNCSGNWRGSDNNSGGTPASENSINGQFIDTTAPQLVSVVAVDAFSILVTFSKSVSSDEAREELNYTIDNGLTITSANIQNANNTAVLLLLSEELQSGEVYNLTVSNAISDCLGNMAENDETRIFGLAEEMEPLDVVINEVLFNPRSGGVDFVEFYNRSNKIFNFSSFTSAPFQFLPGEYVVITENPDIVLSRFNVENPQNLFLGDLPPLNNDTGEIVLISGGITIDSFAYSEEQHFELLNDVNGVSLERISPDAATNEDGNWNSAAAIVGYGTPTAKNSQFTTTEVVKNGEFFQIPSPRVSPDEDGFEDVLLINYKFDESGYVGNIKIFDNQGRLVKTLINNELLGSSGILSWDGSTNDKAKARIGIYVFWAELYRP